MVNLTGSVGRGGKNIYRDVVLIQRLLKSHGISPGPIDGICGPRTIAAILRFQSSFLTRPDGLIEPYKITSRRLKGGGGQQGQQQIQQKQQSQGIGDNSAQWTQDKKLASMNPHFRHKVIVLLQKLKSRGFQPTVVYGWRSVALQQKLLRQGVTKVRFSFHNAQTPDGRPNSFAADIVDRRYAWSEKKETHEYWKAQGEEAKRIGLFWGGDWKKPWDPAHVQYYPNSYLSAVKKASGL